MAVALLVVSCGDGSNPASETVNPASAHELAHEAPPEMVDKVKADVAEDLDIISRVTTDTASFPQALTGKALADMKKMAEDDLAAGRYRVRDYRNVSVEVNGYTSPVMEVRVDFEDFGYYADASTGQALDSPSGEQKALAMAVVEEDGRWKIKGIFSATGTETATQPAQ